MPNYLSVSQENGLNLMRRNLKESFVMLNLLNFREKADYSGFPDLDPGRPISGHEAYLLYMDAVKPLLAAAGSELLFMGKGGGFVIGPEAEGWDAVLLVRQPSVERFIAFASDQDYLAIAGHRTAALRDSRLLPLAEGVV